MVSAHVPPPAAVRGLPFSVAASLVGPGLQSTQASVVAASRQLSGLEGSRVGPSSCGHRLACSVARSIPPNQGGNPSALHQQVDSHPRYPGKSHTHSLSHSSCELGIQAQLSYIFCIESLSHGISWELQSYHKFRPGKVRLPSSLIS